MSDCGVALISAEAGAFANGSVRHVPERIPLGTRLNTPPRRNDHWFPERNKALMSSGRIADRTFICPCSFAMAVSMR